MKYTIMDTLLYASEMNKDVDVLLLEFAGFEPSEKNLRYIADIATPHARVQALRHVLNAAPQNRISVAQQAIKNLSKWNNYFFLSTSIARSLSMCQAQ